MNLVFAGKDQVGIYRAIVMASALELYARTGMKPNRAYTPTAMMRAAREITGRTFKARDYQGAATALRLWAKLAACPYACTGQDYDSTCAACREALAAGGVQ